MSAQLTQRLINIGIGALLTLAILVMLPFIFATTQPYRTVSEARVATE